MKQFNIIIAVIVVTLSAGLLIQQRFNEKPHASAFLGETEYKRGETIRSNSEVIHVTLGESVIWLDENTEVKILASQTEPYEIAVLQGRVVIEGNLVIKTREVTTQIEGTASFVHYSWEDKIDVARISGKPIIITYEKKAEIIQNAVSLHTLPPYEITVMTFDPTTSSAADFYKKIFE